MAKNSKSQNFPKLLKSSSFIYTRFPKKVNQANSEIFYTLAPTEKYQEPPQNKALKAVQDRQSFLVERYDRKPSERYDFPIATSMRYGWFHNIGTEGTD